MASLKKLAGQTVWYGVSNIAARFLTYLLTPYFTYVALTGSGGQIAFGQNNFLYSIFPIMNVLYTYGMETAFFRFSQEEKQKLYNTQVTTMLLTTLFFTALLLFFQNPLSEFAYVQTNPEYISWCAAIIALDALSALPFAKLRRDNRPRKYAAIKVAGILVYVGSIVFLFSFGDDIKNKLPDGFFARWYERHWGIGFILFANVLQAAVTLLLLAKEFSGYRPAIDKTILKKVLLYSWPILIAGFAGQINDGLNRIMFAKLYKGTETEALKMVGFYGAAVRLSVMITLATQAFRMAAEPFFFSISSEKNAPHTYARIMKWYLIALALMFLNVVLFFELWKYFVGPEFRDALGLVPLLMLSNIFLGVYYNLTIWYKLTDKTHFGAYIMLCGAAVTITFNWLFIPFWGWYACAVGLLLCNGLMMFLSYNWGQKFYPIPYEVPKLSKLFLLMLLLFGLQWIVTYFTDAVLIRLISGAVLFVIYLWYILKTEKEELKHFPFVGKFVR